MSGEPENLMLVYLRRMDQRLDRIETGQAETLLRVNDMARQIAGLRRDLAGDAETVAHLQAQMDRMREEIIRIQRRLDISEV